MNNIREIERLNQRELDANIPLSASWHNDWSDTAYVYIGGLPYELSEGDIITIFSQYGTPVHVNLIRDKDSGKSKGFAFLKYEDQRSTALAVDNLGGAVILGRTIRVDHTRYKPKEGDGTVVEGLIVDPVGDIGRNNTRNRSVAPRSVTPESFLPEEIELQKLIRDHDEDDPMKDYLVKEKRAEVDEARKRKDNERRSSKDKNRSRENKLAARRKDRSRSSVQTKSNEKITTRGRRDSHDTETFQRYKHEEGGNRDSSRYHKRKQMERSPVVGGSQRQ